MTARDASGTESAALGLAAKKLWSDRKQSLAAAAPFYDDEFQDRFIVIELTLTLTRAHGPSPWCLPLHPRPR